MNEYNSNFMKEAISLSQMAIDTKTGGPFGAVIVKDREIVGRGRNRVTIDNDPTAHAEVNAIREACRTLNTFNLSGCVIYTSCEPCPMCFGAISWARLDKIYYAATKDDAASIGFDDAFLYKELSLPKEERHIPTQQIEQSSAVRVFTQWATLDGKIDY